MTYLVESRDDIQTLPHAVWLARVTATTVGYGDVTPDTQAGHEVVGILYRWRHLRKIYEGRADGNPQT
jgi:hypothetical protein